MKPSQIAIGVLLAAAAVLLAIALWPTSEPAPLPQQTMVAKPKPTPSTLSLPTKMNDPVQAETPAAAPGTPEAIVDHHQMIATKCQEMMDLAMMDDQASLKKIWKELSNPEKEIRIGAVDAIVQFGDRSKVKALKDLAEKTDDPDEKKHIQEAADFLTLPPMNLTPGATQMDTPLPPQTPAP